MEQSSQISPPIAIHSIARGGQYMRVVVQALSIPSGRLHGSKSNLASRLEVARQDYSERPTKLPSLGHKFLEATPPRQQRKIERKERD